MNTGKIGSINPFRFKGYYYDNESGMYYCHTRYFVPEWGRWLNADNVNYLQFDNINGMNLFAYCANNPVMNVDPEGTFIFSVLALIVAGVLIGRTISGVLAGANASEGESFGSAFLGGFINGVISGAGLAAGLALAAAGGLPLAIMGGAIAVAGGFVGGFLGSATTQAISYGDVDWKVAGIAGGIGGGTNLMLFAGLSISGMYSAAGSFLKRFVENLAFDIIPLSMSIYLGTAPMFNPNDLRGKL